MIGNDITWVGPKAKGRGHGKIDCDIAVSRHTSNGRNRYTFAFYNGINEMFTDNDLCMLGFTGNRVYFVKPPEGMSGFMLFQNSKGNPNRKIIQITDERAERFTDFGERKCYEMKYDNTRNLCYIEL